MTSTARELDLGNLADTRRAQVLQLLRQRHAAKQAQKTPALSLFFFAADQRESADARYRLLLDSVAYADKLGMHAVWLPERHFHDFGGAYPNPSVLAAAVATRTERMRIRAGSVVSPLHHPIRIAEEWAVVDNLSRGRVDLAFASGWNPNDFVLAPQAFAERRDLVMQDIAMVRRLWSGDKVSFPNGAEVPFETCTYPRPVQKELTCWLTCTRDRSTFERAGAAGVNVLTALLFQDHETLAANIEAYRDARRRNGHDPHGGRITVMLHAFVGDEDEDVRTAVRGPFSAYLERSVELWRHESTRLEELDTRQKQRLLEYAFERYYHTSTLMGSRGKAREKLVQLSDMGVDEVACLIDFGMSHDATMQNVRQLCELVPETQPDLGEFYDQACAVTQNQVGALDYLTFGILEQRPRNYAWLHAFAGATASAEDIALTRASQERLRGRLFSHVRWDSVKRALDIGCGYGSDLLRIAKASQQAHVVGFTLSAQQARHARKRFADAGWAHRADIRHADVRQGAHDAPYDLVLGFEVAVYMAEKGELFAQLGHQMAPDGVLLLAEMIALGKHPLSHDATSSHIPTLQGWAEALAAGGLAIAACDDVSRGVGSFLDDPDFAEHLAKLQGDHDLSETIMSHLRAHHGLGLALRAKSVAYVLMACRKSPLNTHDLVSFNLGVLTARQEFI